MTKRVRRAHLGLPTHCIFCERPLVRGMTLSGEHLYSEWMHKKNRLLPPDSNTRREEAAHFDVGSVAGTVRAWKVNGSVRQTKIRVVCMLCNNTWMSKLDNAIIPIAEPLLRGDPTVLTYERQLKLSEWIALKALVVDCAPRLGQPSEPMFSQNTRTQFMGHRRVPEGFTIWMGPGGGPDWRESAQIHQSGVLVTPMILRLHDLKKITPARKNVCTMTWGAGHVVFSIVAVSDPKLYDIDWDRPFGHVQLWPPIQNEIQSPPGFAITDWKIKEIAFRHHGPPGNAMQIRRRPNNRT